LALIDTVRSIRNTEGVCVYAGKTCSFRLEMLPVKMRHVIFILSCFVFVTAQEHKRCGE